MSGYNYGPPKIDFSPLERGIEALNRGMREARKYEEGQKAADAFHAFLMGKGGQVQADEPRTLAALGQGLRSSQPQSQPGYRSLAKLGETYNGVHIAENEDDVQRLERATGMNTAPDLDKVVRTVYGEASGEGAIGRQAVAGVIANRARESGMTPTDVVLAKGQFEPWSDQAARARMEALDPNSPEYKRIAAEVAPILSGEATDPTGGATHFYAPKAQAALGRNAPSWDDGTGQDIGNHRFFSQGYNPRGPVQVAQADIPAAGAQNAQGFMVPGQDGRGSVPPAARPMFSPQEAMQLRTMFSNEATRPLALYAVQQRMGGKSPYSFTTINGQLVRTRSDTGAAEIIPGIGGQQQYRSLTDPAERARYGIPDNDTRPYQVGPDGKLSAPPGGTNVNVDNRAETAEASELGKEAGKATAEMYKAASSAGAQTQTLNRLQSLLANVETGKLTPARMSIAAWGKAAGVSEDLLKQMGLDPAQAGTGQAVTAIINQMVTQQIGSGGFPANNFSDADRAFLTDTMTKLSNDPRGNALIIEAMKRTNALKVEKAKAFRQWKGQNKGGSYFDFETDWAGQMQERNVFGDLAKQAEGLGIVGGGSQRGAPISIRSADEYNRLPSGSTYVDPQGNVRTKR